MKECSYCGQRYPDDLDVCPIDHAPLIVAQPPRVALPPRHAASAVPPSHPAPPRVESKIGTLRIVMHLLIVVMLAALSLLIAGYVAYACTRPPSPDIRAIGATATGPVLLTHKNMEFREGTLVRVSCWAGVLHPVDPQVSFRISIDAGRVGRVVGVLKRDGYAAPAEVLEVQWLEQEWACFPLVWRHRKLEAFTATIHPDWVEPVTHDAQMSSD